MWVIVRLRNDNTTVKAVQNGTLDFVNGKDCSFWLFRANFFLADLDFRSSRRVRRYDSRISEKVNVVFAAQVVFVKETLSEALNDDKKSAASFSLNWYLAQCSIPNISFQLASLPGTSKVKTGSGSLFGF